MVLRIIWTGEKGGQRGHRVNSSIVVYSVPRYSLRNAIGFYSLSDQISAAGAMYPRPSTNWRFRDAETHFVRDVLSQISSHDSLITRTIF